LDFAGVPEKYYFAARGFTRGRFALHRLFYDTTSLARCHGTIKAFVDFFELFD
jgi:hypothetical protein